MDGPPAAPSSSAWKRHCVLCFSTTSSGPPKITLAGRCWEQVLLVAQVTESESPACLDQDTPLLRCRNLYAMQIQRGWLPNRGDRTITPQAKVHLTSRLSHRLERHPVRSGTSDSFSPDRDHGEGSLTNRRVRHNECWHQNSTVGANDGNRQRDDRGVAVRRDCR